MRSYMITVNGYYLQQQQQQQQNFRLLPECWHGGGGGGGLQTSSNHPLRSPTPVTVKYTRKRDFKCIGNRMILLMTLILPWYLHPPEKEKKNPSYTTILVGMRPYMITVNGYYLQQQQQQQQQQTCRRLLPECWHGGGGGAADLQQPPHPVSYTCNCEVYKKGGFQMYWEQILLMTLIRMNTAKTYHNRCGGNAGMVSTWRAGNNNAIEEPVSAAERTCRFYLYDISPDFHSSFDRKEKRNFSKLNYPSPNRTVGCH